MQIYNWGERALVRKKSIQAFIATLLLIVMIVLGLMKVESYNLSNLSNKKVVVRIAHVAAEDTSIHLTCVKFKELLEEESNGKFQVHVYPNAQLGGDRQNVESIMLGYLTGGFPGAAVLAGFEPRFMVIDLPFLFKSREAAFKSFDNELGDKLNGYLNNLGIHNLGFGETGYRYISSNNRPIQNPDDLKGLKIRTMENPIHIASFRAWGASPTPMSFSELFTALQQGAVEAQENPLQIMISSRFYEVQNTLSMTGHFFASGTLILGEKFMEGLNEEDRNLINKCGREAILYEREITVERESKYLEQAKENNMQVFELTAEDKDIFIKKAESVYEKFAKDYPDGRELIDLATKYDDTEVVEQ